MQQLLVLLILLAGHQVHLGHGAHLLARVEPEDKGDAKMLLLETKQSEKKGITPHSTGRGVYW